jgi:hypothetical protein
MPEAPVQAWLAPTHMRTVPPPSAFIGRQQPPAVHAFPAQQTWPDAPQGTLLPPVPPPPGVRLPPPLLQATVSASNRTKVTSGARPQLPSPPISQPAKITQLKT